MIIRVAEIADQEEIIKLWLEFFTEDTDDIVKTYLNKRCKNGEILVAIENDKLVGFIGFAKDVFFESDYIEALVVDKNFRRKGIAKSLVQECEKQAMKRGCRRVFSSVEPSNLASFQMHRSLGYIECGYVDHIWGENKRDIFFTKKL